MNRKKGVILSNILMIFQVISTLILTPFIIRTLGQAEYGVFKLATSVNGYLLLLDLGIGNAIVRYVSKFRVLKDNDSQRKFLGVATVYYLFIAILTLVIGCILVAIFPKIFAKGLNQEEIILGQKLLAIGMINSSVTLGTAAYNYVIIAYEKYEISKGFSILQIILRMILIYVALKAGMGSLGIVSVGLISTILCRAFFVVYVLKVIKIKPIFRGISFSFIKEIVVYSTWILLQMIATEINATADQILLGSVVESSASIIAVYGIGTQIVFYFQNIGTSFTGVLMPGVVKMVEQENTTQQIFEEMVRVGRIIFMSLGMIWGCFLVYGKQFVVLWAGENNYEAYYVSIILMTAYLLMLTEAIGTQVLWAKNEHKEQAILKLITVLINVVLTLVLIEWKPLIGATIGTFISIMVGDVLVLNIIYKREIGISLKKYYIELLRGLIPCLIILILSGLLINHIPIGGWLGFFLKVASTCLVYCISLWVIGMNSYEKHLVQPLLKKIIRI